MCLINFSAWFSKPLFHFFNTNSQIFMSIYVTLFSVGQFSFIEPIILLLLDFPVKFLEIHILGFFQADFVFNGHFFFPQLKKI